MGEEDKRQFKRKIYAALIGCVVVSWYLAGALQTTFSGFGHTWSPFGIAACMFQYGFPAKMFLLFLALFGLVIAAFVVTTLRAAKGMDVMGRSFKMSTGRQSYGQAHFETPDEYVNKATIESPETAMGTIMGQLDKSGKHVIAQRMDSKNRGNRHVAVLGSSGSGKTYTFVKTSCYQVVRRRESIIITDPDGGLFRDMSAYFADNGYVVRHLDLNDIRRSDGWDCLKAVSPETAELDAQMFAQTIIANVVDDPTSIYATGPMALLKALILRVVLDPDLKPEEKNIGAVYKNIQNEKGEEYLDQLFDPTGMPDVLKPCVPPYLSFKQGSPNLRGNLITNLSVQLQLFQNDMVCKLLSTDDIDLELPGQQPCAYFCGFPDSHDTYRFIVSLFFSMIFIKLIHYSDVVIHKPLPVPVNFLLDEFPSIGCLPDWDKKMATIRKRNMNVTMIFQDIMQFQNVYERSWGTILGNCSTLLILGINEDQSSALVTKRIGDTTIEARTDQHAATESFLTEFNKHSTGEGRRALVSYDELYKIDEDNAIILFQAHDPILCWKFPHVLHPESKKLREIDYDAIPDIEDVEGRKRMREAENAYIAEYLRKHPLSEVDRSYAALYEPQRKETVTERVQSYARKGLLALADIIDEKEGADHANDAKARAPAVAVVKEENSACDEAYCPISIDEGDLEDVSLEEVFGLPSADAVDAGGPDDGQGAPENAAAAEAGLGDIDEQKEPLAEAEGLGEPQMEAEEPDAEVSVPEESQEAIGVPPKANVSGGNKAVLVPEVLDETGIPEDLSLIMSNLGSKNSVKSDRKPKPDAQEDFGTEEAEEEIESHVESVAEPKGAADAGKEPAVVRDGTGTASDEDDKNKVELNLESKPEQKVEETPTPKTKEMSAAPAQDYQTQAGLGFQNVERARVANAKKMEKLMEENSKSSFTFSSEATTINRKNGSNLGNGPMHRPGKKVRPEAEE